MRRWLTRLPGFVLAAATVPLLLAMGGGGTAPLSDTIPHPEQEVSAELVDRQGVSMQVSTLSCNGKTFLPLSVGEGVLMVPFDRVDRVAFGDGDGKRVPVTVTVSGGRTLEGFLPAGLACTGSTEFGNFRITSGGIREIRVVRP